MIHFTCPNCLERFRVDDKHAGRKAKCSACDQSILIPKKTEVETYQDLKQHDSSQITPIPGANASDRVFSDRFERVEGIVVKVESRVASMSSTGLGAGFSVPIEDLGISLGTGLAGSKSRINHEYVVWVKQENQNERRFVFEGEVFPCREENKIAIGLIGSSVLVAKNFSTNKKVIINRPEIFFRINPPDFKTKFHGLLAAFFIFWFLLIVALSTRVVPYGTYKPPIARAIDVILIF